MIYEEIYMEHKEDDMENEEDEQKLGLFSAQESETALNAVMNYIEQRDSYFTFEELSGLLRCYLEASVKAREIFQVNDKENKSLYLEARLPNLEVNELGTKTTW